MSTVTGIVKWFNDEKGYGFIKQDGVDKDIFVHHNSIVMPNPKDRRTLREGQKVSMEITDGKKGPQAENVKPLD